MRKHSQYSNEFKEKLLAKVFSPNAISALQLAKKAGVPYPTLTSWISMRKKRQNPASPTPISSKDKEAPAKFQAVFDTLEMSEVEKGAYCRKHGFYPHHLEEWKMQMLSGVETTPSKTTRSEKRQYIAENKRLTRELARKDKALAEVTALLVLKKKADLIWGDGEDD